MRVAVVQRAWWRWCAHEVLFVRRFCQYDAQQERGSHALRTRMVAQHRLAGSSWRAKKSCKPGATGNGNRIDAAEVAFCSRKHAYAPLCASTWRLELSRRVFAADRSLSRRPRGGGEARVRCRTCLCWGARPRGAATDGSGRLAPRFLGGFRPRGARFVCGSRRGLKVLGYVVWRLWLGPLRNVGGPRRWSLVFWGICVGCCCRCG